MPNCSATTRGAWLGSITPPDPTRIVDVASARAPTSTGGAELAIPGMLWCSATQCRVKPHASARTTRSRLLRSAWPADEPLAMGDRSSTDSGTGCGTGGDASTIVEHPRDPVSSPPASPVAARGGGPRGGGTPRVGIVGTW